MKEKHIGYFRLAEACGKSGCPVCRFVLESTKKNLEGFLHESVNDPELRKALHDSWGLCN